MPGTRKRPCRICRRWFYPDPRAGDRQRTCSTPHCQTARRQKTQANWRANNPGYAAAHRIDQRLPQPNSDPDPPRVPKPFDQLPWDLAKDEFGGKGADFIALMCTLVQRDRKDEFSSYPVDTTPLLSSNPAPPQKTSPPPPHTESRGAPTSAATGVSSIGPPPGAPPAPPPGAFPAAIGLAR